MKALTSILVILIITISPVSAQEKVERWGVFEYTMEGPSEGNPFAGVELTAQFTHPESGKTLEPRGFYDGEGTYKVRFMPVKEGKWKFETHSNKEALDGKTGEFMCTPASEGNHGPVEVRGQTHFQYADSTRFYPFGTTIYEWAFNNVKEETIETLKASPFNKARMLAVPPASGSYEEGGDAPMDHFPFEGTPDTHWDFSRFDPVYFQQLEERVKDLRAIGVQADFILFRPYDGWGFAQMPQHVNKKFVRYIVARFAAFRNIWWSLANENDYMESFTEDEWDELFKVIKEEDPYNHLRSIHNGTKLYDYSHPWVTHASLQYYNAVKEPGASALVRDIYEKPVVFDEIHYEGNLTQRWGQLSGEEMTYRFWNAYMGGCYATHGEATSGGWIAHGGKLTMESPERIAFLKDILVDEYEKGLERIDHMYLRNVLGREGEFYLYYLGKKTPEAWKFTLPEDGLEEGDRFKVEVIDTWNMTINEVDKVFELKRKDGYDFVDKDGKKVNLPGKKYMALRIRKVN